MVSVTYSSCACVHVHALLQSFKNVKARPQVGFGFWNYSLPIPGLGSPQNKNSSLGFIAFAHCYAANNPTMANFKLPM